MIFQRQKQGFTLIELLVVAGIVNILLFDGSTRSLSENIDLGIWRALGTRNGGEVIGML